MRLIKRSKRQAEAAIKPKEKKRAERDLEEARVMLNYVLHFPCVNPGLLRSHQR